MIKYKVTHKNKDLFPEPVFFNIRAKETVINRILTNPGKYKNPDFLVRLLEQQIDVAESHGEEISIPNNKIKGQYKN